VWVDLAPLTGRGQIHGALGRALDTPLAEEIPAALLARVLHDEHVLVVLDNAEHVVDDLAALVSLIASAAPHVRVLVTSQLPLAIREERVDRLEPLSVAPATAPEAEALSQGAMALLVDRIGAADHRFRVTPAALPLLREICVQLDGMPLALEMAAARVPLLGLQGVNDALSERFALLTTGHRVAPGRHKTLHAALDWCHGLLGDAERRLFRTLGVFSGGFTLDLVAAVAADEQADRWSVIDRLAVLVDRSLVAASHDDPPRYHLLETMRAYALERLAAAGEEQAVRRRHAHALTDLMERTETAKTTGEKLVLQKQAHAEIANVREALTWALRNDSATAVRLAARVASVTTFTLWRAETLAWLAACEPLVDERLAVHTRALWLYEYGRQLSMSSRTEALEYARRARDLYRELGEDFALFKCHIVLVRGAPGPGPEVDASCAGMQGLLERHPEWPVGARMMAAGTLAVASELRGDKRQLLVHREHELSLARQVGHRDQIEAAESNVIFALFQLGRAEEALAHSTALMQRIGHADTANAAYAWANHIDLLAHAGRYDAALQGARRALELARRFDAAVASDVIALLVARLGRARAAARLIGHSWQAYGDRAMSDSMLKHLEVAQSLVRERLDEATVARLIEEGRSLDDAAIDRLVFATHDE
jgi:non-specific serine/threonine protein kinase